MFKKLLSITLIAALLLSSFYTIQLVSTPVSGPDLVSAATTPAPAPVPVPKPTPVPVKPSPPATVPEKAPGTVAWSSTPSVWATADLVAAEKYGLILSDLKNQYNKPITRLEFARLIVNLNRLEGGYASQAAILAPFSDTTSLDVAKAYELGLVKGVSASHFSPNSLLTRQEFAAVLYRLWHKNHAAYQVTGPEMKFSDLSLIADWAKEATQFLSGNGLMKGNEKNQLDPRGNTTREQAFILVLRSYQKAVSITTPDAITSATGTGTYPDATSSATGSGTSPDATSSATGSGSDGSDDDGDDDSEEEDD